MLMTIGELSRATGMQASTLHIYLDSGKFNKHRHFDNSREFIISESFINDLINHLKYLKSKRSGYKSYEANIQRLIKFKLDMRASALFFYGR